MNPFDYVNIGKNIGDTIGNTTEKIIDAMDKHSQSQANIELMKINSCVDNVISGVNAAINVANSISKIIAEQKNANAKVASVYADIEIKIEKSKADIEKSRRDFELKESEINEKIRHHQAQEAKGLQEISNKHEEKMLEISEKYRIKSEKVSSEHEVKMIETGLKHEEEMERIANERARIENEKQSLEYAYNLKKQWLENQIESIRLQLNAFIVYINTIIETKPPIDTFLALTTKMNEINSINTNMQSNFFELKGK